jgi:hypothetical protein
VVLVAAGRGRGEVEDVALGEAHMIEDLPGRVGQVGRHFSAIRCGKVLDGRIEVGVGLAALEERQQLRDKRIGGLRHAALDARGSRFAPSHG